MARYHTVTVETVGYFTLISQEGIDVIEKWLEKGEDYNLVDNPDTCIYSFGDPEIVEDKITDKGREVTIKTLASINKNIVTTDEEYKVFKLIEWNDYPPTSDDDRVSIKLDYDEKFDIIGDDSWWVEDNELPDFYRDEES